MTAGVYAITNTADGTVYVGSSIDIEARWVSHRHTFSGDAYEWSVLEEVDPTPDALETAEQRWMDCYAERLSNIRKTARRQRVNRLYLDLDGLRLQERREALGYSLNGLAHEFRCAPSSIKRWEDGVIVLQGLMAVGVDTVLRRLEAERRRRSSPGGHAFVPLSGSQDASGRYTRCGVNGCDLSPEQHERRPSPGGTGTERS